MEAAAWTAIGLLAATTLGNLFYLGSRIDAQSARIDGLAASTDALIAFLESRFDRIDQRFDRVDGRPEGLRTGLDSHIGRHAS